MVVIERRGGSFLLLRIDFADHGGNGKRVGREVRNIGCRMAVGGRVRGYPRVNQRAKPYRRVVGIESNVGQLAGMVLESEGISTWVWICLSHVSLERNRNRIPQNRTSER
jgi:hypothetical protein